MMLVISSASEEMASGIETSENDAHNYCGIGASSDYWAKRHDRQKELAYSKAIKIYDAFYGGDAMKLM